MVAYHYLIEYAMPSTVMTVFMTTSLVMGYTWRLYEVAYTKYSITAFTTGLLATTGIFVLNWLIISIFEVPLAGIVAETSPFYIILFYASVGVAEELMFTVFLFSWMLRFGAHPVIAIGGKTLLFIAYHNAVAITIFGQQIFAVTHYSILLYAGSLLLTTLYYYTRWISVPVTGHALLNAIVMAVNIGVLHR